MSCGRFKLTYTRICAKVRRHLPARRLEPGELRWIAAESHMLLAAYLADGATYGEAYEKITVGMIAWLYREK